jgi:3-deoxy-D-manno-octulosonate 8-phosphate phosphatase (KDO 8-P phosphatase)
MEPLTTALRHKLTGIDMLLMDVDGTLTDGGMWYDGGGQAHKRFFVRDGLGLVMLREAGIPTGIVTARTSKVVEEYAKEMKIPFVVQGMQHKADALPMIARKLRITAARIAYIGDDINDIPLLELTGFSAAPADAADEVKRMVNHVTTALGGAGAVREICDMLLAVRKIDPVEHVRASVKRIAAAADEGRPQAK